MDKFMKWAVWLFIITPVIYLAIVWNRLPEKIAVHFNIKGEVDRYGSANELLLGVIAMTVMGAAAYLILANIYRIDPKKYAAENKSRLQRMGFAISVLLAIIICVIINAAENGNIKFGSRLIFIGVGLLFAFIGNYMHSIKPNYFAGIRLPWTLENEDNWKKTHLLAGKLFFAGGLLIAAIALVFPPMVTLIAVFSITFIITVIPCVYSYRLYKKQKSLNNVN